ncbi:SidE phosphodiesterase domain-containing protein, partial [Legionella erythra]|uniref:SidE phosphodiesterase domain-containing protein n=1 Tax=Legionella erythra TaxID=448 RepID=UPI001F5F2A92
MSYSKVLGHLKKGPRLKSDATKDLEKIVRLFLNPTQKAQCRFNPLGELEVGFNDQIFNLTQILLHQPDFEHFSFSDEVSEHYEMFIETASHKPSLEGGVFIPRREDYEKADKNKRYTQLKYGEKLAITLYTSNFYEEINAFLRSQGRDISFKELSWEKLTVIVKEIVLASCLAAHGLTRLELPNDSDDSNLQEVYRAESSYRIPESVWKQRHKAIDTHIPIRQDGFISSSEDMNAMKLSGTDTTLKISQPHHAIGKRVQDLSYKGDEQEVLLVPGTQLAFGSFSEDKGRKVFEAFVVRSLDGIDPSSYSTVNAGIRTQLISLREQVDYLIRQVPPPQKTSFSLWRSLSNSIKKTEIVELQDQIKQFDKLIFWFEDNKHKTSDKIAKLEALNKKMRKLVEKVRDSNLLYEPLKDASTKISHLIMQLKIDNSSGLIREAGYVYTHHLSKAYKETELESTDAVLARDNQVIHRPNHGLAHSLRVATYIPLVVEYFQQFAKPKLSQLCQNLNSEELKKLQLCMLFSVSGRESDLAFKSNP